MRLALLTTSLLSCAAALGAQGQKFATMAWHSSGRSNAELVANLKRGGIVKSASVEAAMLATDRGDFAPHGPYEDRPQYMGHEATISAPHMHAYALEMLADKLVPGAAALDVGSGSGYLCAAMGHMVGETGKVAGIEHVPELVETSIANMRKHHAEMLDSGRVTIERVSGFDGLPKRAPFDAIHVGAAAAKIPVKLVEQLKAGGRMIIPVGPEHGEQWLMQVDRSADGSRVTSKNVMGVRYVPLTSLEHQLGRK